MFDFSDNQHKLKIELGSINTKALSVKLDMPYTDAQILSELKSENWVDYAEFTRKDETLRLKINELQSPILHEIHQYFHSDSVKKQIIDAMFRHKNNFHTRWGMNEDAMFLHSVLRAQFVKDKPGYHNGLHLDPRILYGTGMIYFNAGADHRRTTYFYDSADRANPMTANSDFCHGWFLPNDEGTWHDGWNKTTEDRYSLLLGLSIKLSEFSPGGSEYRYFVRPEYLINE